MSKRIMLKNLFLFICVSIASFSLSNINLFGTCFVFAIPFTIFCFILDRKLGLVSFFTVFINLYREHFLFLLFAIIVFVGIVFVKRYFSPNNFKLKNVFSFYCFITVFASSLFNNYNFIFSFFCGVISYWVMVYFLELYLCVRKRDALSSRLGCFLFIMVGVMFLGLKFSFYYFDITYIALLFLLFIGLEVGFEVGTSYAIILLVMAYSLKIYTFDLILFIYSFLFFLFIRNVSKVTRSFVYLIGVIFIIYYYDFEYVLLFNYVLFSIGMIFVRDGFIRIVKTYCLCNEVYVEKIRNEEKHKRMIATKKILNFAEVFYLVNDKLDVKNRIKKNDRSLLAEEINIFNNLLLEFTKDIKENVELDNNYRLKKEFYRCGVDLVDLYFEGDNLEVHVGCHKKEIKDFIVPLIKKILNDEVVLESFKWDYVYGYYILNLREKNTFNFKYGISQKSLEGNVCGDSYLVYENDDVYMFVISDGMGNGEKAREASKLAISLLKKFLDVGFSVEQTVKSLNSVLKGKYNKELYSTLDLFFFDKKVNKFYFCKNGAADSYLIRDKKVCFKGNNLPLGIVDNISVNLQEVEIQKDDILVMASDGVEDKRFIGLELVKMSNLQKVSEKIIGKEEVKDDKTVFVIKIC